MSRSRNGSWIQTFTGRQFWPLDPRPEEIDVRDIAHSLSLLCRFNGHCRRFYSVAEHCIQVSTLVPPEQALWGLLHDAAEAYLSDIPQPVKRHLETVHAVEARLLEAVALRFGLSAGMPDEVARADAIMLATEKLALMGAEPAPWHSLPHPLNPSRIHGHGPEQAEALFLARYARLRQA